MLKGGGIGQPSDPPGGSYYRPDPPAQRPAQTLRGYCSDVFTDAAIDFVRDPRTGRRSSSTSPSTARTTRSRCPRRTEQRIGT